MSSLLESPGGYSILFAESLQAPVIPELQIVKTKASTDYKQAEAKNLAKKKSEEILASLQENGDLEKLATDNKLELKNATLTRTSPGENGNGFPPSLLQNVFALNASKAIPEEPAKVGELFYIYQFTERTLPDLSAISDEEKEQFTTQIINNKQERLLIAWIRNQEQDADIFTNKNIE